MTSNLLILLITNCMVSKWSKLLWITVLLLHLSWYWIVFWATLHLPVEFKIACFSVVCFDWFHFLICSECEYLPKHPKIYYFFWTLLSAPIIAIPYLFLMFAEIEPCKPYAFLLQALVSPLSSTFCHCPHAFYTGLGNFILVFIANLPHYVIFLSA